MGFSITSAVFGGIIIICYGLSIGIYTNSENWYGRSTFRGDIYAVEVALSAIILILGIVEFIIGILASAFLCMMKPCRCCCHGIAPQQVSSFPRVIKH